MDPVTLVGDRLSLRPWRQRDAEDIAALNADTRVMHFFVAPLTREQSDAMFEHLRACVDQRGWGNWCVDIAGECAGFAGLSVPAFEAHFMPCVEIGWRFRPQFWGHGYATEAARLALDFGFGTLQLPQIVSFTAVHNLPSRRVMERIGMQRDLQGDFDHPRVPHGHALRRHVLYRIDRPRG